ncbi:MAG: hypothetical protein GWP08_16135 [Nitrospiraceae bacterium]|nr:hypothetical protein [Nitrospiraceae bacterium]
MLAALITVLLVANAAPGDSQPGEARQIYVLILNNGTKLPCFWDEKITPPGGTSYRVEIDTPWLPENKKKLINESDIAEGPFREKASARAKRIAAAGYTVIDGAYYLTSEVELAQRAREMAGVRETSDAPEDPPPPVRVEELDVPSAESQPPEQAPAFVQQWGLKAGVILVALALMIAVAKFTLLARG